MNWALSVERSARKTVPKELLFADQFSTPELTHIGLIAVPAGAFARVKAVLAPLTVPPTVSFQTKSVSLTRFVRSVGTVMATQIDEVASAMALCVGAP